MKEHKTEGTAEYKNRISAGSSLASVFLRYRVFSQGVQNLEKEIKLPRATRTTNYRSSKSITGHANIIGFFLNNMMAARRRVTVGALG